MKISKEDILNVVITSKILEQHISQYPSLKELLSDWNNPNIHYGQEFAPTAYQKQIYERRMKMSLENAERFPNASFNASALQELLAFMAKHSESQIFTVVFNCADISFDVWCGILGNQIKVICILKG